MPRSVVNLWFCLSLVALEVHAAERPAATSVTETVSPADDVQFFEQQIRPILAESCFGCHSTHAVRLRADLLLDSREGIGRGGEGGPILVAGEPERSRLIEAIRWTNPDFQMPPKQPLSAEQIAKFEEWVKRGAPYPQDDRAKADQDSLQVAVRDLSDSLWALQPVVRPEIPSGVTDSANPIDAFLAAEHEAHGLTPTPIADKATRLRRVYLDLIGIPPSPKEQAAFLGDPSADAYEKVVDQLLTHEQHGVRYARHWLDVLRYADVDERMLAAKGIHLWRDWVIRALNDDLPYDQFVRAQLTGYRSTQRTQMSATGHRSKAEPRPDDLFALGFLARGAVIRDGKQEGELAISAVETVSSALMGMTVACAKCHDHVYDPITQRNYYEMKALFDPLVPRKIILATADERFATGRATQQALEKREPLEAQINQLLAPYKKMLYDERVTMLPADVQVIILKPEGERSASEQKIADDYFPILRIDLGKILEVMPNDQRDQYRQLERQLSELDRATNPRRPSLTEFWTVEVDSKKETETSYVLTSGDPERPELNRAVNPGWPFAPSNLEFREGRIEAFSDWLTSPDNGLFARVAVNRIWQWHFGDGLHKLPSDFGKLSGVPSHPQLLDWLASEFVRSGYSMRAMHRLIVTSQAYQRASSFDGNLLERNRDADPTNIYIWHFPLQRLSAEAIWDSMFCAAGSLDLSVGGPSYSLENRGGPAGRRAQEGDERTAKSYRRAAYMTRGYSTNRDVMANFLQAFDVDDGRVTCPQRTQTVTATQGLFLMNSDEIEQAAHQLAERLKQESGGDLAACIDLGYRLTLAREPSAQERARAIDYLQGDANRLPGLAWLLFNLDEFIYVR